MNQTRTRTPIKYIATINPVRETSLVASADLAFWRNHLRDEGLFPFIADGRAEIVISSLVSRYRGLSFHELNIAVQVCDREDGSSRDGLFFVAGFNTSRLFTFFERWMFKTPYRRASIQLKTHPPASFALNEGGITLLEVAMSREDRDSEQRNEHWEGALYLPGRTNVFFAELAGDTLIQPFDDTSDVIRLTPSEAHSVLNWLIESDLAGREWHTRERGIHSRSKTYKRQTNQVGETC